MPKVYVASFHRASDGAISKLVQKMKDNNLYTDNHYDADYILAVADRQETFDFVLKMFRKNKNIIHLWAGEISQGTHDEVYRHAMTLMSMMQLCTNDIAKYRVELLCNAVDKEPNAITIGNIMLDNLEVDEDCTPNFGYDIVLYNPPSILTMKDVEDELEYIMREVKKPYIWIEANGDKYSELINSNYANAQTFPRPKFLGLLKHCRKFITNSSCQYYEAPFLLKPEQIVSIGERNIERESKYADMDIEGASDKVIEILKELPCT